MFFLICIENGTSLRVFTVELRVPVKVKNKKLNEDFFCRTQFVQYS